MLKMAVKARLPLIRVESDDPVNIGSVLDAITEKNVLLGMDKIGSTKGVVAGDVRYLIGDPKLDPPNLYGMYATRGASLIVVNPKPHPAYFDAGFITAPKKMIQKFVMKHTTKDWSEIADALSGLSFKQAVEISKLAMSEMGNFTPRAIQTIRRQYYGTLRGLEQVGEPTPFYQANDVLMNWLKLNMGFMFADMHPMFRARGLLFNGYPGTGKTEGAKFVAAAVKQPLYRMNIGALMSKWAGESEHNLEAALRQAGNCAPCVLLFDEVEKLFKSDDSGVTTRLLATLLWWLQEHKSKVFTIMTTNDFATIPPELVRPGRIDKVMEFPRLNHEQAILFMDAVATQFYSSGIQAEYPIDLQGSDEKWSQAELMGLVIESTKKSILDKAQTEG